MVEQRVRRMIGHGAVVTIIALLAGFGLVMSIVGGFEAIPGQIIKFEPPGDSEAWARAHAGGLMNGLLVFVGALLIHVMDLAERAARSLFWMLVGTGYANTFFYWGSLFADNRALTFADNREGQTSVAAVIALAPALLFAVITIIAMVIIARSAFQARG